jgi:hypothetical protein
MCLFINTEKVHTYTTKENLKFSFKENVQNPDITTVTLKHTIDINLIS